MKDMNLEKLSVADKLVLYSKMFYEPFPLNSFRTGDLELVNKKLTESIKSKEKYVESKKKSNKIKEKESSYEQTIPFGVLIKAIKESMSGINYDYKREIKLYESVSQKRKHGHIFLLGEHIKGLVYANLYNNRWGNRNIIINEDRIRVIFKDYDVSLLMKEDMSLIFSKLKKIHCTNANTKAQILVLKDNIEIFKKIEQDYGSMEDFVNSEDIMTIARYLYRGKYRLKQAGVSTVYQYLLNIGFEVFRPCDQINRLLGCNRLNLLDSNSFRYTILKLITNMESKLNISKFEIYLLLQQFCSVEYSNICVATPNCQCCKLKDYCLYNK